MSSRRVLKDLLYEQVGRLVKGMANAKRLELVELLCQAPKSVETLATEAGISVKLASAHLKELRLAHLVDTEKQGRQVIYRIACPEVAGLLVMMRTLAEDRLFELQHSLKELSGSSEPWVETDSETLWHRAQHGEVTVIDVRPVLEYAQRHLPYARSMPRRLSLRGDRRLFDGMDCQRIWPSTLSVLPRNRTFTCWIAGFLDLGARYPRACGNGNHVE